MAVPTHSANNRHSDNWWLEDIAASLAAGAGGGGGGAVTIANGDDAAEGSTTDAAASAGGTGTISAKLRKISADIATLITNTALPTAIGDGLKLVTTAGTRETLVASSTPAKSVTITAKLTNTGTVVIGGSTVVAASGATRRGTPLNAGDNIVIDIDDLVKIYVDVTVNGEGVTYTYTS